MNRMQFIGRLGQDIELRKTEQGTSVIEFSLADTEKYKDQEKTTWLRCVAWSGIADTIAKYVRKGDKIYVEGKYRHEEYTKKNREAAEEEHSEAIARIQKRNPGLLIGYTEKNEEVYQERVHGEI